MCTAGLRTSDHKEAKGQGWERTGQQRQTLSGIPQDSVLGPMLFKSLLMTYQNVSKAVAKSLLMILRYWETSIYYKNGLTRGIYTLMLQSVKLRI